MRRRSRSSLLSCIIVSNALALVASAPALVASAALLLGGCSLWKARQVDLDPTTAEAATVVERLPMQGQIYSVSANGNRREILVAGEFGLVMIDVGGSQQRRTHLTSMVSDAVAMPDGETIYAVQPIAKKLVAVRAADGAVAWSSHVANFPWKVAPTPDGRQVYVTQELPGGAAAVDGNTHEAQAIRSPTGPFEPFAVAVSPNGRHVCFSTTDNVYAFDTFTNTETFHVAGATGASAFSPDGSLLYRTGEGLTAIDTRNGQTVWTMPLPWKVKAVALSADGRIAYLNLTDADALVSADLEDRSLCQLRKLPEQARPMALSPDEERLYLGSASGNVLIVDASELDCD